jgi:hypothetical protein
MPATVPMVRMASQGRANPRWKSWVYLMVDALAVPYCGSHADHLDVASDRPTRCEDRARRVAASSYVGVTGSRHGRDDPHDGYVHVGCDRGVGFGRAVVRVADWYSVSRAHIVDDSGAGRVRSGALPPLSGRRHSFAARAGQGQRLGVVQEASALWPCLERSALVPAHVAAHARRVCHRDQPGLMVSGHGGPAGVYRPTPERHGQVRATPHPPGILVRCGGRRAARTYLCAVDRTGMDGTGRHQGSFHARPQCQDRGPAGSGGESHRHPRGHGGRDRGRTSPHRA